MAVGRRSQARAAPGNGGYVRERLSEAGLWTSHHRDGAAREANAHGGLTSRQVQVVHRPERASGEEAWFERVPGNSQPPVRLQEAGGELGSEWQLRIHQ